MVQDDAGVLDTLAQMRVLVAQLERENAALRHIIDNPAVIVELSSAPVSAEQVQLLSLLNHWQGRARSAEADRDKLQRFKDWVHAYLDAHGVPHHPPGIHGAEGCRIGDRMDWLMEERDRLRNALRDYADWAHDHGYVELSRAVKARAE